MRILSLFVLSAALALFVMPSDAQACIQKLKPEKKEVKKGETVTVTVSIKYIHDPCVIDLEDTKFKFTGVKKLSMTKFKKKGKGRFEATLKVKITDKKAIIEMWRVCSKSGKHGTKLEFDVK
ncbi:hypothetical protein KKF34_06920 [Myxococcota bacterium]|nr:hypothetical protein [Myxococcota bacterium]MBU1381438.1 hypothetical protein [Myxococcota bacterium]MBU1496593.1 hypothetical protein [Myxococcota bacterium]